MIKDIEKWHNWEFEWEKRSFIDVEKRFKILNELLIRAREMGVWPPEDPLHGIEVDIKIARVVNTYVESSDK